jgi:hypothetical protein
LEVFGVVAGEPNNFYWHARWMQGGRKPDREIKNQCDGRERIAVSV